jgi:hypothetical protein
MQRTTSSSPTPIHGDIWRRLGRADDRLAVLTVCGHHEPPHVTGCWLDRDGTASCQHVTYPLPRFLVAFKLEERGIGDDR